MRRGFDKRCCKTRVQASAKREQRAGGGGSGVGGSSGMPTPSLLQSETF